MRRLVYHVATSLDGFIAGPHGEYDWITPDPSFDFGALWNRFDTLLMGRRTFEVALTRFDSLTRMGKKIVVISTTLDPVRHPQVTILSSGIPKAVAALKAQIGPKPTKDIWLMGGGALFRSLLDAGLVDAVELAVIPVLLGSGVPLLPEGRRCPLEFKECRPYPSGMISLVYSAAPSSPQAAPKARPPKSAQTKRRKP
jgi:dihydrofolate reductase